MPRTVPTGGRVRAKCGHLDLATNVWSWNGDGLSSVWWWDGDGLSSAERRLWRSRRALVELVGVLLHDEAFVAHLSDVRSASDRRARAWQMARRYGIAGRRAFVAALFARGAEHDDLEAAGLAMCNLGTMAVISDLDPSADDLDTSADDLRPKRHNTYLIGGNAFLVPIQHGCELLAAKGRGQPLDRHEERVVRRLVATILDGVRRPYW